MTDQDPLALALRQSFGFFTDIPDAQWEMAQKLHAKTFPNHFHPKVLSLEEMKSKFHEGHRWYSENFQEEFHCALAQRIPATSAANGPKWVCDPHRIAKQEQCLVYSFGCFGNVAFERGVKDEIGHHCEIHTFDIVTFNEQNGDFQKSLENIGVHFHHWGLGTKMQAAAYARTRQGPPLYTLAQTMAMLNHTGREIDIFKIDCEHCEWETYPQFLDGVFLRQILVEVCTLSQLQLLYTTASKHFWPNPLVACRFVLCAIQTHLAPMPQAKNFFYALHDAGYVIFSKEANYVWQARGAEFAFLKLHPDFFINNTRYSSLERIV